LELKLVRKLNVEDFQKPGHFDKMKVSKSTSVLNRDVSASLKYLVSTEEFDQCYKTTAWFVEQVLFNKYIINITIIIYIYIYSLYRVYHKVLTYEITFVLINIFNFFLYINYRRLRYAYNIYFIVFIFQYQK